LRKYGRHCIIEHVFDYTVDSTVDGWTEVACDTQVAIGLEQALSTDANPTYRTPLTVSRLVADYATRPPALRDAELLGRVDPSALDDRGLIDYLTALGQQAAFLDSQRVRALAEIKSRDSSAEGWSREAVMCALRVSGRAADTALATAATLHSELGPTLSALRAGSISADQARAIAETSWTLPADQVAALQSRAMARAGHQTVGELRQSLRRAVLQIDPAGGDRRHRIARTRRAVRVQPADDGMAEVRALLRAEDARALYTHVDAASRLLPACDGRSRDEQRADLLVDAVLNGIPADGLPELQGRRPSIQVTVALSTLLGLDSAPAELAGYGAITAEAARRIAHDPSGTWHRLVTDPITGQLLEYGRTTYRPPAALVDHVIARDRECALPGCHQAAQLCDLDHRIAFEQGGSTGATNIFALCRRHHRLKTHTRWAYRRDPDGTTTWTSPTGHTYSTSPRDIWVTGEPTKSQVPATSPAVDQTSPETIRRAQNDRLHAASLVTRRDALQLARRSGNAEEVHRAADALQAVHRDRRRELAHRADPEHPPF
jgi:hypothetical protein